MEKEKMKKVLELLSESVRLLREAEEQAGERFVSVIEYKHDIGCYVMIPFRYEKEVEDVAGMFEVVKEYDDFKILTTEFEGMTILNYKEKEQ